MCNRAKCLQLDLDLTYSSLHCRLAPSLARSRRIPYVCEVLLIPYSYVRSEIPEGRIVIYSILMEGGSQSDRRANWRKSDLRTHPPSNTRARDRSQTEPNWLYLGGITSPVPLDLCVLAHVRVRTRCAIRTLTRCSRAVESRAAGRGRNFLHLCFRFPPSLTLVVRMLTHSS